MKKRLWALSLAAAMGLSVLGCAEGGAAAQGQHAEGYEQAVSAFLAHTPGAAVDYALRERDDGRYEWDLFFTLDGQFGKAEVDESDFKVRSVVLRDMPEGAKTASQIVDALVKEKGDLRIVDLDLDADKSRIRYEGEAEMGEKRYEFEMDVFGNVTEWERD